MYWMWCSIFFFSIACNFYMVASQLDTCLPANIHWNVGFNIHWNVGFLSFFWLSKISHQSFCLSFSIYFNVNTTFTRQIHQLISIKNNSDKHNTVLLLFYECSDIHNSHNNTEHQIFLKIKWKNVSRHRCSNNNNWVIIVIIIIITVVDPQSLWQWIGKGFD